MIDINEFNKKFEEIFASATQEDLQTWLDHMREAEQEELSLENCYKCGSPFKEDVDSLHIWGNKFECGAVVGGAIGGEGKEIITECPK